MARVDSLADRKALLFSAGGVRLALRVSQLREIVAVDAGEGEVRARGETLPTAFVATVLGLPVGASSYALLTEGAPRAALRVEAVHGIVDLAAAEVFQLPARTSLPQPPPFAGAIVSSADVALELAVSSLGFAPLEPAIEHAAPPPDVALAGGERELRFSRSGLAFAVPLSLVVQVVDAPRVVPVPLTPPSHVGLLYHGRALHPVLDVAVLYGGRCGAPPPRQVLLLDAGGTEVGVAADRVFGVKEGEVDLLRPPWDAVFAA